jgi:EpsI family protein
MRKLIPFVPAVILFIGCAAVWDAQSQMAVPLTSPLSTLLREVDGYAAKDQTLSADEQRVAGMSTYMARVYQRGDSVAFTTLVTYYERQTQGRTIHSPRNCLPGAGWEILTAGRQQIAVAGDKRVINRYLLRNGKTTAVAYYWYQGRGRVTASEYAVKWNLLRDAALLGRTEEALVRVVVPIAASPKPGPTADSAAVTVADATAMSIAGRLMTEMENVLPSRDGEPAIRRTAMTLPDRR